MADGLIVLVFDRVFELGQRELALFQVASHELRHDKAAVEEGLEYSLRCAEHALLAPLARVGFILLECAVTVSDHRNHAIRNGVAGFRVVVSPGKSLKRPFGRWLHEWPLAIWLAVTLRVRLFVFETGAVYEEVCFSFLLAFALDVPLDRKTTTAGNRFGDTPKYECIVFIDENPELS